MSFWQTIFRHEARQATPETRRLYAQFEIAHTMVDFAAAFCFIVGSIMFFWQAWTYTATWFFTIGSFLFAMKPTLKLWREIRLYRTGQTETLADRL